MIGSFGARMLETWTTPHGVRLTVAGRGGPWIEISGHSATHKTPAPLAIPILGAGDAAWYYRNGWQLDPKRLEQVVGRRADA
jgi:hypothetical protein